MSTLQNKIDFVAFASVSGANPNGDPLDGNRPRTDYNGYGEISDVCLKRKIRKKTAAEIQSDPVPAPSPAPDPAPVPEAPPAEPDESESAVPETDAPESEV